jgi:hypothetical protein
MSALNGNAVVVLVSVVDAGAALREHVSVL